MDKDEEIDRLREENERLRRAVDTANQRLACANSKLAHPDYHRPLEGTLNSHERRALRRARKQAEQRLARIEELRTTAALLAEKAKLADEIGDARGQVDINDWYRRYDALSTAAEDGSK